MPPLLAFVALSYDPKLDPSTHWYRIAAEKARANAVRDAIEQVKDTAQVILFSGYTATAPDLASAESTDIVTQLRQAGLWGVFELVATASHHRSKGKAAGKMAGKRSDAGLAKDRAYFVAGPNPGELFGPFRQYVVTSGQANSSAGRAKLNDLARDLERSCPRRLTVAGLDLALLICGEDNLLYEPRQSRIVQLRYPDPADDYVPKLDHKLLFNPRHSISRRWELEHRLEYLATRAPCQVAVSCANYERGRLLEPLKCLYAKPHTQVWASSPTHDRSGNYVLGTLRCET